ncbi:MAG TPA: hypothetical protein VIR30_19590 [Nocardioides sp.]
MFPTWARNLLKEELAESPATGQWPEKVVLPACEPCNGGLGREFENPVAPILKPLARGISQTLDRDQMRLVAAWARLKDIEYILGRPYLLTDDGRIPFSESNLAYWRKQLTDLRATRKPPRGYVLRLAILGAADETSPYRRFLPNGWGRKHASMTSINAVGLLVLESLRVDAHNAAAFNLHTRHDSRATLIWPGLRKEATIGDRRVPLNHASRWRGEHAFHPQSGWGGGWQIRVGRPA